MASSSISASISPSHSPSVSPSISPTWSPSASASPSPPVAPYGIAILTAPMRTIASGYKGMWGYLPLRTIVATATEGVLVPDLEVPRRTISASGSPWCAALDEVWPVATCESYAGSPGVSVDRPSYEIEAAGHIETLAYVDAEAPVHTIEANGNFISSSLAPVRTIEAEALVGAIGSLDVLVPGRTLVATAVGVIVATVDASVPSRTISASDLLAFSGTMDCDMPRRSITSSGLVGEIGRTIVDRALYTMESAGYTIITARVNVERGFFTIDSGTLTYITLGTERFTSLAVNMNVKRGANSEFTNYAFESLAMFNGKPFGSNSNGLYELTGADDAGTDIAAEVETGKTDLEIGNVKKPWSLHLGMAGDGTVRAKLKGAKDIEITGKDAVIQEGGLKIKHSRDTRSSYWGVYVKNLKGADFQLNSIDLVTETLGRREDY